MPGPLVERPIIDPDIFKFCLSKSNIANSRSRTISAVNNDLVTGKQASSHENILQLLLRPEEIIALAYQTRPRQAGCAGQTAGTSFRRNLPLEFLSASEIKQLVTPSLHKLLQ